MKPYTDLIYDEQVRKHFKNKRGSRQLTLYEVMNKKHYDRETIIDYWKQRLRVPWFGKNRTRRVIVSFG
jgi:hypothetical protein